MQSAGITWSDIGTVIILFITVAGAGWAIWWRIEGKVKEAKRESDIQISAAVAKADLAREEIAAHRTHTAENYISKAGFRETMESLSETLKTINANLTHLNERIDRVIDNQHVGTKRGGQQ